MGQRSGTKRGARPLPLQGGKDPRWEEGDAHHSACPWTPLAKTPSEKARQALKWHVRSGARLCVWPFVSARDVGQSGYTGEQAYSPPPRVCQAPAPRYPPEKRAPRQGGPSSGIYIKMPKKGPTLMHAMHGTTGYNIRGTLGGTLGDALDRCTPCGVHVPFFVRGSKILMAIDIMLTRI